MSLSLSSLISVLIFYLSLHLRLSHSPSLSLCVCLRVMLCWCWCWCCVVLLVKLCVRSCCVVEVWCLWCGVVCGVVMLLCCCVCVLLLCVWRAENRGRVDAENWQHVHMKKNMWTWCHYTRGDVLNRHKEVVGIYTRRLSACHTTHTHWPRGVVTCSRGSPKQPLDVTHFKVMRVGRAQHVPDSSNHSHSLMDLLSSSYPEGNCGGNQL